VSPRGTIDRMKQALGAALVGLLPALPLHAQVDRAGLVMAGANVLKVEVLRHQGGYALGSGVVVGDGLVVTNCHVTRDGVGIHVLRSGHRWPVQAQASDAEHDLCVLRVPGLIGPGMALGKAAGLKAGQSVTAVGYTGGLGIQSSAGAVVALHRHDGANVIQSDNWFSSGASGGALLDDQLRLVGVLTFRLRGGTAHYFAAPTEWLLALTGGDAGFRPVAPADAQALPYWQRPPRLQPRFLQAAALEHDRQWEDLQALAVGWSAADADDPTPWNLLGLALDRLGRLPEAQSALEQSLRIDPSAAPVWLHLGRLHARQGALQRAREVRSRLEQIAPLLARELELPADGS